MIAGREPVLLAAGLAAILQGGWMIVTNDLSVSAAGIEAVLLPALTLIGGWFGRSKSVPVDTLDKANISVESIKRSAGIK